MPPPLKLRKLDALTIGRPKPLKDLLAHVKPSGDVEADAAEELSETMVQLKARAKAESQRFQETTDSEYWTAFVFQSRAQKEAFLIALKLLDLGDKYIDGQAAAKRLGIELPPAVVKFQGEKAGMQSIGTIDS